MKQGVLKKLASGVVLLWLTTAAAWAGLDIECFCAHLNGVDRCGNLICRSEGEECNATFIALVNTCSGKAIGTATGCVRNYSCRLQIYCNNNCFGYIHGICDICSSLYIVSGEGKALLIATGHVCD
jgi:hypothetical protein